MSKVAAKYRDPDNKRNSWSGRGRMPPWPAQKTKHGRSATDFLIPGIARPTAGKCRSIGQKTVVTQGGGRILHSGRAAKRHRLVESTVCLARWASRRPRRRRLSSGCLYRAPCQGIGGELARHKVDAKTPRHSRGISLNINLKENGTGQYEN